MNVSRLNAQLQRMGQDVLWARASYCPCRDPQSGDPSSTCKMCRARGFLWDGGLASRVGISGMSVQREWVSFGMFEGGDVVVSVGSDQAVYAAGEKDRIIFNQSSEPFDTVLTRGAPLEFRIFAKASMATMAIVEFNRCFWLTPAKDAVIEGGIPTQLPDGTLTWPAGGAPPDGVSYTVRGRKRPEYFVFKDFPRDRAHFGGQALPRRITLRRWDLFAK